MAIYDIEGNELNSAYSIDSSFLPQAYDIEGYELLSTIKILEYNVGNFSQGGTTGYSGNDLAGYMSDWISFISSCNSDVCLFTESRKYVDSSNTTLSANGIYSNVYSNVLGYYPSTNWGAVLLSNASQSDTKTVKFTNQSSSESKYVGAMINLKGVNVYVVSVHFIHGGTENATIRTAQMNELITALSSYDNVIIGGDFNTHVLTELSTLQSAGFTFANDGVSTFSVSDPTLPLDNVGVRGNKLSIQSFNVLSDVTLSDHMPTITEILVG